METNYVLTEFLDRYRVEWSTTDKHSRSGWVQIRDCPYCHNTNYHLGIKADLSRSSCYSCGGKHVPKVLKAVSGASWSEINNCMGDRAYIAKAAVDGLGKYTPPTALQPIAEVPAVKVYLENRGYDIDYLADVWKVQATGNFSNFPRRAFLPVYNGSRLVSWTARAACGQEPRYQTANNREKSFHEKHLLFGNQFVRDTVIICEGPLSAIRVGRGATATFGLAYTPEQVLWLAGIWHRVIVFDNSVPAQRRARELALSLSGFPGKTTVVNLDAPDPGEASDREIDELRALAGLPKER